MTVQLCMFTGLLLAKEGAALHGHRPFSEKIPITDGLMFSTHESVGQLYNRKLLCGSLHTCGSIITFSLFCTIVK